MFTRVRWFTVGVGLGAAGTVVGDLRARELARCHLPTSVQDATVRAAARAEEEAWLLADRTGVKVTDRRENAADARIARREAQEQLHDELDRAGLG